MSEAAPSLGWSGVSDKASYYRLFAGYVLALFATGIATVALALLAFDLTGDDAGAVVGTALSLKMLAIVVAAPMLAKGGTISACLWTHVRDDRPFAGGGGARWNRWEIGGWKVSDMRRVCVWHPYRQVGGNSPTGALDLAGCQVASIVPRGSR